MLSTKSVFQAYFPQRRKKEPPWKLMGQAIKLPHKSKCSIATSYRHKGTKEAGLSYIWKKGFLCGPQCANAGAGTGCGSRMDPSLVEQECSEPWMSQMVTPYDVISGDGRTGRGAAKVGQMCIDQ